MAVVAALLFFGSLLLHELGHALQARREGMEIEGITLWLFGGVAKFKGLFPSAGRRVPDRDRRAARLARRSGVLFVLIAWPGLPLPTRSTACRLARLHQPEPARLQPAPRAAARRRPRPPLGALGAPRRLRAGRRASLRRSGAASATSSSRAGVALFIFQGTFSGAWLAFIGWFLLAGRERRGSLPARAPGARAGSAFAT